MRKIKMFINSSRNAWMKRARCDLNSKSHRMERKVACSPYICQSMNCFIFEFHLKHICNDRSCDE